MIKLAAIILCLGQTLQEKIDALPDHSGGVVEVGNVTITEPIRVMGKAHVTLKGEGMGRSAVNARLTALGPAFYVAGSSNIRLVDFRVQGLENCETGVLLCRMKHNGKGASNALDRLNIQGDFVFACVASIASENLEIRDCRLNPRLPGSYGWWTGSTPPRYIPPGNRRPRPLRAPGPVEGGTNSGVWIGGRTYIASTAEGVTSIYMGDGTVQGHANHVYISNSSAWNPQNSPIGRACVELGAVRNVVLDNIKCESADAQYGLLVSGIVHQLTVQNGRYGGRQGLMVEADGGLINSEIGRSTTFTTFGDRFKPIRIEGKIQGTVLDISPYTD